MIRTDTSHTTNPLYNSTHLALNPSEQFFHGSLQIQQITVRPPVPPTPARPSSEANEQAFFTLAGIPTQGPHANTFRAYDTPHFFSEIPSVLADAPPQVRAETAQALSRHTAQAQPLTPQAQATLHLAPAHTQARGK
jgi:hypothetical protein